MNNDVSVWLIGVKFKLQRNSSQRSNKEHSYYTNIISNVKVYKFFSTLLETFLVFSHFYLLFLSQRLEFNPNSPNVLFLLKLLVTNY